MNVGTYLGKTAKSPAIIFFECDPKKSPISITNQAFLCRELLYLKLSVGNETAISF
jgi:hypothetical protein